jgi:hypothetical protein
MKGWMPMDDQAEIDELSFDVPDAELERAASTNLLSGLAADRRRGLSPKKM